MSIILMYNGEKMAEAIGRMSMIKKTSYQLLYHLTCSFEEVLWIVSHRVGDIQTT